METKIEKFEREAKEMKKTVLKIAFDRDVDFTNVNNEEVLMLVNILKLFDVALELTVEEAKKIDAINEKIDKLMAKVGA